MFKTLFLSAILGVSDAMMLRDVAEASKKKPPKSKSSSTIPSIAPSAQPSSSAPSSSFPSSSIPSSASPSSAQPSSSAALCTDTWICGSTDVGCYPGVVNCLSVESIQASCSGDASFSWGYNPPTTWYPFNCDTAATTFDIDTACDGSNQLFVQASEPSGPSMRTFVFSWVPVTAGTCSPIIDWD